MAKAGYKISAVMTEEDMDMIQALRNAEINISKTVREAIRAKFAELQKEGK